MTRKPEKKGTDQPPWRYTDDGGTVWVAHTFEALPGGGARPTSWRRLQDCPEGAPPWGDPDALADWLLGGVLHEDSLFLLLSLLYRERAGENKPPTEEELGSAAEVSEKTVRRRLAEVLCPLGLTEPPVRGRRGGVRLTAAGRYAATAIDRRYKAGAPE